MVFREQRSLVAIEGNVTRVIEKEITWTEYVEQDGRAFSEETGYDRRNVENVMAVDGDWWRMRRSNTSTT